MGMGSGIQLGMGSTSTINELYEYKGGDLRLTEEFYDARGISGSRSRRSERVRRANRKVGGTPLNFEPNVAELVNLLPRILGGSPSGTTYPLAETLPSFWASMDKVEKVYTSTGCVVSKATFSAEQGGSPLKLALDIEATDQSEANSGTFPALTLNVASGPFLFSDAVISVGGSTYSFKSFELTIDNVLDTERFLNSTTRTLIPSKDRIITVKLMAPHVSNTALYNRALAGDRVIITLTNADVNTVSLVFDMVAVQFPKRSPQANELNEIDIPLEGVARRTSATLELVTTLDSTP